MRVNCVIHRRISSVGPQKFATAMNRIWMGGSGKRPTYPMVVSLANDMISRRYDLQRSLCGVMGQSERIRVATFYFSVIDTRRVMKNPPTFVAYQPCHSYWSDNNDVLHSEIYCSTEQLKPMWNIGAGFNVRIELRRSVLHQTRLTTWGWIIVFLPFPLQRVVFHGRSFSPPIRSFSAPTFISQKSSQKAKSPYELGPHRSDAEDLAADLPIIEVDSDIAVCSGGKQKMRGEDGIFEKGSYHFALEQSILQPHPFIIVTVVQRARWWSIGPPSGVHSAQQSQK